MSTRPPYVALRSRSRGNRRRPSTEDKQPRTDGGEMETRKNKIESKLLRN